MESLQEHLLSVHVFLISTAAWFVLWVLRKIWKGMDTNKWASRFKPLYPALLCQVFVWLPGALPGPEQGPEALSAAQDLMIGHRILMGLWCGFLASIGYQLVKRFLKPQGIVLPEKPEDLMITDLKKAKDNGYKKFEQSLIDDDDSQDTPIETPSAQLKRARTENEKKVFVPPKSEDLFKPPKM